jgi:Hydrazine synthase alpha subunit middle domain
MCRQWDDCRRAKKLGANNTMSMRRWLTLAGILAGVSTLSACSGGGSVDIGSGQSPDPATVDFPIFYVKRTIPMDQDDLRQLRDAIPNADLYKRDRASPSANETNITDRITGATDIYDVKDVDVSADGKKVVFALRGPLTMNMEEDEPPTWQIWQYDITSDTLTRVIASDTTADAGNDVAPHYLPNGDIIFSSSRQRMAKAILLDENKPQFEASNEDRNESAFVLHRTDPDSLGTEINQLSFNVSDDVDSTVLSSGRILISRWDHAPGKNGIHLYTMNPDGTDLQLLYGANSHNTGTSGADVQFVKPREMMDGRILAILRPFTGTDFGGDPVIIDTKTYVENNQPTLASAGMSGPAQTRATQNDVRTIPGPSPGGRFQSAFPLWDGTNRILVSWSQCRLLDAADTTRIVPCTDSRLSDPNAQAAPPLYSIWMFDPAQNSLMPVLQPTEGVMFTDVVAAQPRALPTVILDKKPGLDFDDILFSESVGILNIKSVYDFDGTDTANPNIRTVADPAQRTAAQRLARFIRIEKPVSIPDDDDVLDLDDAAFGATPYMREILAYAPIEPDGSVRIKVPANVAFQISILDADGRRISPVHANWLQVRPGEELKCNGCHQPATAQNPRSHGRAGLFAPAYTGASSMGPFPNTNASFSANPSETMAETRSRVSCASDTPRCAAMSPSVNLVYTDVWTNPAVRMPDADLQYLYSDLKTPSPTTCTSGWSSGCRIVINYAQHIHPLWSVDRRVFATNGALLQDGTCTSCHSTRDAANAVRVPAGQLDLSDGASDEQPLQLRAYRELLFTDNEQEVNMGALQDRLVPGPIDPATGLPTQVGVTVAPSMTAGNARGSTRFFSRFAAGGSHEGFLTPAELRLLSEWLDIGAQYFNNPFDPAAPKN